MKQSKLAFTASKRTASTTNSKKTKSTTKPQTVNVPTNSPTANRRYIVDEVDEIDSFEETSSESESEIEPVSPADEPEETIASTPSYGRVTRSSTKAIVETPKLTPKATPKKDAKKIAEEAADTAKPSVFRPSNATPEAVAKKVEANEAKEAEEDILPSLNPKLKKYTSLYNASVVRRGSEKPIHGESQNRILEILSVFDNSPEYGPCVGVSRRERWDRAKALGLNPPEEIDEILDTKEGRTLTEYTQTVFYGEV